MTSFAISIDARGHERGKKKDIIFGAFEKLKPGESLELINDHDPSMLYQFFEMKAPEQFEWEYLEQGPEIWRIGIIKK